jgi:hypothetical protein
MALKPITCDDSFAWASAGDDFQRSSACLNCHMSLERLLCAHWSASVLKDSVKQEVTS